MITLENIYDKLTHIENQLKEINRDRLLGIHAHILPTLEEHAQHCPNFKEFYVNESKIKSTSGTTYFEPTLDIKCSCNDPQAHIVIFELNNISIPYFRSCIDDINKKYNVPSKPHNNPITALEL